MGKPSKCLSAVKWINKLRYIHTVECYTAIRRKKSQLYTTVWINLKNTIEQKSDTKDHKLYDSIDMKYSE